jgi:hypothetical protein
MAEIWGAVIAGAAALGGAYMSADASKKAGKKVAAAGAQATTELLPYQFYGPGGQFSGFSAPGAINGPGQLPANYGLIGSGSYGGNVMDGSAITQQPAPGQPQPGIPAPVPGGGLTAQGADIWGRVPNIGSAPKTPPGGYPSQGGAPQQSTAASLLYGTDPLGLYSGGSVNARRVLDPLGIFGGGKKKPAAGTGPDLAGAANTVASAPRDISVSLGDLEPARAGLVGLGTNALGVAQRMGGMPENIAQALAGVQGASGVPGMPGTEGLQNTVESTLLQSLFDMNRGSAAPGLQAQAFAGAGQQFADASRGFGDVRDSTLATLRSQAQPFESRQFDRLQNNLFSTGRLGSSGGALQTEAFARGLGQADLDRQLQANNEARMTQQNALGIGQGLAGAGTNIAGLDDSLLQSAFGRFSQTAGLSQGLTQERFGNSMLLNQTGYDRANNNLQNQIGAAGLPMALQGQQLQLALQALQGQGALNAQGLQGFQAALASAQAGANARIGSGSNAVALAGIQAGMPTSGDIWGQALTGIAGRMAGNNDVMGSLAGLFNRSATPTPSNTPGDQGFVGPTRYGQ